MKSIYAAFLAAASIATHAQSLPWQTLYEGPGRIYSALLDPFAAHPQRSLFCGGLVDNGCSVEWIGPLQSLTASPSAVCSDTDPGTSNQLSFNPWSGRLYSAGTGAVGWQVRESADQGNSWTTVDAPFASGSSAIGVASDGQGNVFVCGTADGHWIVRKRNASGSWSTVRDWTVAKKSAKARKICIASGWLSVVGETYDDKWVVQRMNLANNTWDTPFTWAPKGRAAGAWAVTSYGNDIYVLGWSGGNWQVPDQSILMKSTNLGAGPWTTIKTFTESLNANAPADLAFDPTGNLFVVGNSTFYTTEGNWHPTWVVRRCDALSGVWQWWLPFGYPADVLARFPLMYLALSSSQANGGTVLLQTITAIAVSLFRRGLLESIFLPETIKTQVLA
jgi:hypothetical protein